MFVEPLACVGSLYFMHVCVCCVHVCVCVCVCVRARARACVWLSTIRPQYVFNILPFSCNGNDVIPLGRSPPLSYPISGPKSLLLQKRLRISLLASCPASSQHTGSKVSETDPASEAEGRSEVTRLAEIMCCSRVAP